MSYINIYLLRAVVTLKKKSIHINSMGHGTGRSIHNGPPVILIVSRINPVHRINTCFFKVHSSIVFPSKPRPW